MSEVKNIPDGWVETTLGKAIDIKHGYAFKGEFISLESNNKVLITPGNFKVGGGFKGDKFKYYTGDFPEDYILRPNDVIVTMTDLSKAGDTLGFSAKIPKDTNEYLHNQRIGLVKFINSDFDKEFIYWFLRTNHYQKSIVNSSTGSTVRHTSPNRIREYTFYCPRIEEQKAIASILTAFDDKIELLQTQNKTLEETAQTIFAEWFGKYSLDDELPDGWEVGKLGDVIEIKYGKDHKHLKDGEFPLYGSGGIMRYVEKPLYEKESILIPRKGTLSNLFYLIEPFWSVDTMFYSRIIKSSYGRFTFLFLKSLDLSAMNVGSAVPSLTTQVLNQIPIILPTDEAVIRFDDIIHPIYEKIETNVKQIEALTKTLDELLPRLMTGEIRLNEFKV